VKFHHIGDHGNLLLGEILHLLITQTLPLKKYILRCFAQDHYYQAHEANHSKKNCPTFINMFKFFVAMEEEEEGQTNQEEKRDDQNIESSINVIWDVTHGIIDDDEEERSEEICVAQTRSKGLPSASETPTTSSPPKKSISTNRLNSTQNKPTICSDTLDYDLVEDMKNTRANISFMN
jgi:hypothetical protein